MLESVLNGAESHNWVPRIFFWKPTPETNDLTTPQLNIAVPAELCGKLAKEMKSQPFGKKMRLLLWPIDYGDLERSIGIVRVEQAEKTAVRDMMRFVYRFAVRHCLACEGRETPLHLSVQRGPLGFSGYEVD